jgi:hypothetical protein
MALTNARDVRHTKINTRIYPVLGVYICTEQVSPSLHLTKRATTMTI